MKGQDWGHDSSGYNRTLGPPKQHNVASNAHAPIKRLPAHVVQTTALAIEILSGVPFWFALTVPPDPHHETRCKTQAKQGGSTATLRIDRATSTLRNPKMSCPPASAGVTRTIVAEQSDARPVPSPIAAAPLRARMVEHAAKTTD